MPIKWQPFKELEDFNKQNPFGGQGRGGWVPFFPEVPQARRSNGPAIDIYQDKNNLYIEMPLPGVKPENVEISIENNVLSVQGKEGEKKIEKETNYIHREVRHGSFRRVVKLPVEVKNDKAEAEFSNGILKISIPKSVKTASKANKVPIKIK
ncbi:Hsp20/alpha crystallin family protein [Patescibacteria group bacterium]